MRQRYAKHATLSVHGAFACDVFLQGDVHLVWLKSFLLCAESSQVAIFDATNSTEQRRQLLVRSNPL